MRGYILRRLLYMIPTLVVISIVSFCLIALPPGTFADTVAAEMMSHGQVDVQTIRSIEERYGLNEPLYLQYLKWISGIFLHGDFGTSFIYNKPVSELIWDRLGLTLVLTMTSFVFVCVVSFPIGMYSAIRQYSLGDHVATLFGFIGLATPNFLFALVLMYAVFTYFDQSVGGFFSPEMEAAAWGWAKLGDLLAHLWIPVIVIGTASTAALIRIMRANLLDELFKPYVATARAKGLSETRLLVKYPLRVAVIPFVATLGWMLPELVSGAVVVSVVLSLPTTGPMLLKALMAQDMYLAASFIMLLSVLTVVGTLVSDLLLALLDPRIRYR